MIARIWRGWATHEQAGSYEAYLRSEILPDFHKLQGYKGCYLLRNSSKTELEFVAITLWESLEAVRAFAGEDYEKAVIHPEAEKFLTRYDQKSTHYEVLQQP